MKLRKIWLISIFLFFGSLCSAGQNWFPVDLGIGCNNSEKVWDFYLPENSSEMLIAGNISTNGNCLSMRAVLITDGVNISSVAENAISIQSTCAFVYMGNTYASGFLLPPTESGYINYLNILNEVGAWDTVPNGIDGQITDFTIYNGLAYLSGALNNCGGQPCSLVCTFDGVTVTPLYMGQPTGAWARGLEFFQDTLFICGNCNSPIAEQAFGGYSNFMQLVNGQLEKVAQGFALQGIGSDLEIFDNKLFVGGWLKAIGDDAYHSIYYYQNGQLFTLPEDPGFQINAMKAYQGGLYVVGDFTQVGATPCNNVARWDGQSWTCLSDEVLYMQNGNPCQLECINDIEIWNDTLYIGGAFHTIGNSELKRIAKLNLNLSEAFPVKVKEYEVPNFSIFPNPSSAGFSLSCPALHLGEKVDWKLIDVTGKSAISGTSTYSNPLNLDTHGLASGVYYLQLQCEEWSATKAVVVE